MIRVVLAPRLGVQRQRVTSLICRPEIWERAPSLFGVSRTTQWSGRPTPQAFVGFFGIVAGGLPLTATLGRGPCSIACRKVIAMSENSVDQMPANEAPRRDGQALKLGGTLAVVGGLGYFVTLLLHGDLPDETTEAALEHIAGRPEWRMLKLALITFVLCWIGAFMALVRSLSGGLSGLVGRWAVASAIIGVGIVVVEYAIIGHALKAVADAWRVASGPNAEMRLRMAEIMLAITGGLFHSFVAWMLGLPYVLLGLAIALGLGYPRWLGWVAVVAGTGALLAGTTRFLGIDLVPYPLLYGSFILPLNIWLAVMGVLMWRRTRMAT